MAKFCAKRNSKGQFSKTGRSVCTRKGRAAPRRSGPAAKSKWKKGDWVRRDDTGWGLFYVSRVKKQSWEREPRVYIRRWNNSKQSLNRTEDWVSVSNAKSWKKASSPR